MPPSRRDELVETAMRVFYRHGFNATGIEKVLREAGISRMTLYNHFKSKDELIAAALRRRDETFRNKMYKFIGARATGPAERILAVFDFGEQWFCSDEFCGCMFINASAEFPDRDCAIRRVASEHNRAIASYLLEQCREAGLRDPELVARQLHILFEGACARANVMDAVEGGEEAFRATSFAARDAAALVINTAKTTPSTAA